MGKSTHNDGDDVWSDLESALSCFVACDARKVRSVLEEYGLTVVRIEAVAHAGAMLRDALQRKPSYKISFVHDSGGAEARAIGFDFASSQVEAEARAISSFPLYRSQGATSWRITRRDDSPVASGPNKTGDC